MLKEATGDQLVEAVRVIASGEAILAPSVTRRLLPVALGLSNAEIGAKLHLAETTVKGYVQSMPAKHGVRDRLQAAVAAYDSGLVRPGGP